MPHASYAQRIHVASVVAFYMAAALVMVFINKAVLTSSPSLPLLFITIQLAIAVFLLHIAALITDEIQIPSFDMEKCRKLAPLIVVTAIGLVFNTLCLRDVDASFFQIARGLVLPLTIMVQSFYSHHTPHRDILIAAMIVTAGFIFGVVPTSPQSLPALLQRMPSPFHGKFTSNQAANAHINSHGHSKHAYTDSNPTPLSLISFSVPLLYGFLASLTIAFHAVLIKASLPIVNNSAIQLAYWTNAGAVCLLVPLVLVTGEISKLRALLQGSGIDISFGFASGLEFIGVRPGSNSGPAGSVDVGAASSGDSTSGFGFGLADLAAGALAGLGVGSGANSALDGTTVSSVADGSLNPTGVSTAAVTAMTSLMDHGVFVEKWNWEVFVTGSMITGVFGFLLCVAGLMSVKVTSPVTHMFSSAARSVLQVLLGVWLFNDRLTFNRVISIFVITVGTLCYTWFKSQEQSSRFSGRGHGSAFASMHGLVSDPEKLLLDGDVDDRDHDRVYHHQSQRHHQRSSTRRSSRDHHHLHHAYSYEDDSDQGSSSSSSYFDSKHASAYGGEKVGSKTKAKAKGANWIRVVDPISAMEQDVFVGGGLGRESQTLTAPPTPGSGSGLGASPGSAARLGSGLGMGLGLGLTGVTSNSNSGAGSGSSGASTPYSSPRRHSHTPQTQIGTQAGAPAHSHSREQSRTHARSHSSVSVPQQEYRDGSGHAHGRGHGHGRSHSQSVGNGLGFAYGLRGQESIGTRTLDGTGAPKKSRTWF